MCIAYLPAEALPLAPARGVAVYSIFGSLFFGAADKIEALLDPEAIPEKAIVLKMNQLINLDALETVHTTLQKRSCQLTCAAPIISRSA